MITQAALLPSGSPTPVQTPGPATNRLVPPGQGDGSSYSWEQVLTVIAPKELSCCQELKVASRSLLTVNILQPVITAYFNPPTWKKLAVPKAGAMKLLVTASSNTSSFPLESFWKSPSSSFQRTMTNSFTVPEGAGGFGWQEMVQPILEQAKPLLAQTSESRRAAAS